MRKFVTFLFFFLFGQYVLHAQNSGAINNTPQSALDFLTLSIDARSAALGEMGVGTDVDNYSHYYNPAKYLFSTRKGGVNLSYSPWLRNLVKDMNISSLSGYYVINHLQTVSASFRYFSMGDMEFTDESSQYIGNSNPFQLAVDVAYARKLSEHFGAALAFRFALADLYPSDGNYKKGWGVSADLDVYYHRDIRLFGKSSLVTAGASITNIGTKVSFYDDGDEYFMPMNFSLGAALKLNINDNNSISLNGELNRSLVPTNPEKNDQSSIAGMFSSIKEGKWNSIHWALGAEYGFANLLFGRVGYYHESQYRGYRKNLGFGVGLVYKIAHIDVAYVVPTEVGNNAMGNTLRFSVAVDF